jgi:hypothetical protein
MSIQLREILTWRTHPLLSITILLAFSYTALLASPWQYPFLTLSLFLGIGLAAARDRTFNDLQVAINYIIQYKTTSMISLSYIT